MKMDHANSENIDFDAAPPLKVAEYDNLIAKFVPGYEAIFKLSLAHLSKVLPQSANVLVVGAGSGKELETFAKAKTGWSLTGVDPSEDMLALARPKLSTFAHQVTLHKGIVETLPETTKFDAATSILVMHFLPDNGAKLEFLRSIAKRLKPGASFILLDIYGGPDFVREFAPTWIEHGHQMGIPLEIIQKIEKGHAQFHPITEERTMELLKEAGFTNARRFYAALVYCGWFAEFGPALG